MRESETRRRELDRELAFRERQARRAGVHLDARADTVPPRGRPREIDRRRAAARRGLILIPFILLVALGAGAAATLALVNEPKTSSLQSRIDSLSSDLTRARAEISSLRADVATSASATNVKHVNRSLAGLRRTVGGMQNTIVQLRAELGALRGCAPQLQQELNGLTARTSKHGTPVLTLSPQCSALLGG